MVGTSKLATCVLCARVGNDVAEAFREVAKRKGTTVSTLSSIIIKTVVRQELSLKTDEEILEWTRSFLLESLYTV